MEEVVVGEVELLQCIYINVYNHKVWALIQQYYRGHVTHLQRYQQVVVVVVVLKTLLPHLLQYLRVHTLSLKTKPASVSYQLPGNAGIQ